MLGMEAQARRERERRCTAGGAGARRYARHRPEDTMLYQVVEQHVGAFFEHVSEQGASRPGFVREEFEAYLRCGRLEGGFVRAKCSRCQYEHRVAFSCRLRGFCPSCGVREMVESAAHLVDHVLPRVPMRQWVVSFPWPLRRLFAARPDCLTRVLGIVTRALSSAVIRRAGSSRGYGAETGTITFIRRCGSALSLNIHIHLLMPDGAYTFKHDKPRFHRAPAPSAREPEPLLDILIARITRTLVRGGVLVEEPEHPYLDLEVDTLLEQLHGAAVRYRIVLGPQAGHRTMTLRNPGAMTDETASPKPFTAARDGFSINASVACEAHDRSRLERVCRYMARPPISEPRLSVDGDGLVVYELKRPFSDGTTHVLFEPLDFLARLAALVPRPRAHLVRYHGVFAPNARHRRLIVPRPRPPTSAEHGEHASEVPTAPLSWMARLHRVLDIDITTCPRCGGEVRIIATITEPALIARILEHVQQRQCHERPPRAPPVSLAS